MHDSPQTTISSLWHLHKRIHHNLQRRCYWMLEGDDSIVLVHYLAGNAAARLRHPGAVPLTAANLAMQPRNMEVCGCKAPQPDAVVV